MYENLKRVLFGGYSKDSVCEYIARLNEEFSRKVLNVNEEHQQRVRELEAKIAELEKQNEELNARKDEIAQALIDAHAYAKQIRIEADAAQRREIEKTQDRYDTARRQIDRMNTEIEDFKRQVAETLERINGEMSHSEILGGEKRKDLDAAAEVLNPEDGENRTREAMAV